MGDYASRGQRSLLGSYRYGVDASCGPLPMRDSDDHREPQGKHARMSASPEKDKHAHARYTEERDQGPSDDPYRGHRSVLGSPVGSSATRRRGFTPGRSRPCPQELPFVLTIPA